MKRICIGITGGIGSGKTSATNIFQSLGVPVIDADVISRNLVKDGQPALKEIVDEFGKNILDNEGELRRDVMRERVFNDADARARLESIIHPKVSTEIRKQLDEVDYPYCIISSPLLLEAQSDLPVNRILVIDTHEENQLERASKRDGTSKEAIRKILASQASRKERMDKADDVIVNNSDLDYLENQVNELHHHYLKLSGMK